MTDMIVKNMSLKVGHTVTISGVPKAGAECFALNISSGADHALHMNVRFTAHGDERVVVCNSYQAGVWGAEVRQGGFPFNYDELFKFTISLTPEEFLVVLSDASEIHFPNRLGASKYMDFSFNGGVLVRGFEIN
ncbi:beta-galactoside-binding lectin [Gadus morhua]|uniref:Galectin n=1 Tax=Gadus morhua TaxID=8049 RepID=M1SQG6_GADMO|nr:beta-galactoside-binding lectin-like [Gadus morhua]AGG37868.1 galectin-1 isoform [Gadus morhua]